MTHEVEYLRRREQRERTMARRARCKRASRVHHDLAGIYAARRAAIVPHVPPPPSWLGAIAGWLRGLSGRPVNEAIGPQG
ncbi:MAG: hypothetical protein PGN08_07935 [Sphingomonas taxi]